MNTTDLSPTIVPKSDQLNADDLLTGPRTIRVTKVSLLTAAEQPIAINFEGDNGKPYKPCKSMRRVMVMVWGSDGATYAGRSMTLYRDPSVRFGSDEVGGIRISHMSDIAKPLTVALTVSRARRTPYTVKPLASQPPAGATATPPAKKMTTAQMIETAGIAPSIEALDAFTASHANAINWLRDHKPDAHGQLMAAIGSRRTELDMAGDEIPDLDPSDPDAMTAG
jgi:hypothetical protein